MSSININNNNIEVEEECDNQDEGSPKYIPRKKDTRLNNSLRSSNENEILEQCNERVKDNSVIENKINEENEEDIISTIPETLLDINNDNQLQNNSQPASQNDEISQVNVKSNSDKPRTFNGYNRVPEHGDVISSCNVAGTSGLTNRKCVRSKSWCSSRFNDDNSIDVRLLRERLLRTQLHPRPTAIKNFTRSQKLTLVSLALVDFISFCSMSIMAPFFPREAKEKGMTEAVSGFVFSFYALIMFISSPIFGKITPAVGARFLFISGIFMAGSCNLLFGVLEYIHDYEMFTMFCFLIRGFEALGASAYSTASYVFVINMFPNNISSVLGILETFVGLGMSVGPAIGGILYSVGGFGLPFYVLGIFMIAIIPINLYLIPCDQDYSLENKGGSILELIKVPAIVITGLVIVVVSNTWAFLDPTLEPHLRQFGLSPEQVGLVFLLFSALYGIFSPIWGWLTDRINRHWCMMVWGLSLCTVGLLLLGPSPLLPFLESSLALNIIGLSIIGISVALTLLPTFQGVLTSSIEEGGCRDNIATYSVVAGVWSCMYSLGEVIGPSLGGILLKNYGFPVCSTVMASLTFTLAIVTFIFFIYKENTKLNSQSESLSDTNGTSENWTGSNGAHTSGSTVDHNSDGCESETNEDQPLLPNNATINKGRQQISRQSYGGFDNSKNTYCSVQNENSNIGRNENEKNIINNIKNIFKLKHSNDNGESAKQYLSNITKLESLLQNDICTEKENGVLHAETVSDVPQTQLKQNSTQPSFNNYAADRNKYADFSKYTLEKVKYYNQIRKDDYVDSNIFANKEVTDVRGTIYLTGSGACEV